MEIGRREFIIGASHAAAVGAAVTPIIVPTAAAPSVAAKETVTDAPLPNGGASQFAQINGIRLHYVSVGSGPTVILLHGWPQTWFAWRDTMERLSSRFTVIAPDLRGTGLSERTSTGYDKRTIAADIRALVVHVAGERAHVVAHDMGGKAAYVLAHLHPECIEKLVLVDCLIPGTENMDTLRGRRMALRISHGAGDSRDADERTRTGIYCRANPRLVVPNVRRYRSCNLGVRPALRVSRRHDGRV